MQQYQIMDNPHKQSNQIKYQPESSKNQPTVFKPIGKIDMHSSSRPLKMKHICPNHNQQYKYKCEFQDCLHPFICLHEECIQEHFHGNVVAMSKFDHETFQLQFEKAEYIISQKDKLFSKATEIKVIIDSLKTAVTDLFKDINVMNKINEEIKGEIDKTLTRAFLGKVDEAIGIQSKIASSIEKIQAKLKLSAQFKQSKELQSDYRIDDRIGQSIDSHPSDPAIPHPVNNNSATAKDMFFMKKEIMAFLKTQVAFQWEHTLTLYNSSQKRLSRKQFVQLVSKKINLVYLFVSASQVIGSYYSIGLVSGKVWDQKSFIFMTSFNNTILKFMANPDCEYHAELDDRLYISQGTYVISEDGLRISADKPDLLTYSLPSMAFIYEGNDDELFSGNIDLQQILVLQLQKGLD